MRHVVWFVAVASILVTSCNRLTDRNRPAASAVAAPSTSHPEISQAVAAGGPTHPFSVHDMLAMDRISDPQVSPDGTRAVFVVRRTDLEADRGRTDLWLVSTDGTGLRRLTSAPQSDTNPRWSPDGGTICFLSDRSGSSQVWRIAVDGGEAEQVTDQPLDVGNLVVSPDGRHIGYTMDVFPDCRTVKETKDRLDEREKNPATGRIYDHLFVRHWDTWEDGRRSHLFVAPIDSDANAVDVMRGMDADTPSQPFGGPEEITFTPDGKGVVFSAKDVGPSEAWSTDFDLYLAPVDGSALPRCLTQDNEAWDMQPAFSPDGKTLAYLAMARPGYESDRFRIVLMDWPRGSKRVLTESWDRSPSSIAWSSDGATLYAVAADTGQEALSAVDVASGVVRPIVKEGTVHAFAMAADRIVYALSNMRSPAELYQVGVDGSNGTQLTHINAVKVAAARMGDYEQFTFAGWNDETVYGYIVKPADFDPDRKYPVAFLIHGGPQGSFGNIFHYRWNPQAYAGAGYAVVMVDFHGSTGYGQAFCDSIRGDWGGKPLVDLQKGLAAALERCPWMDGDRAGALGASFGGYMINWIAGQWPDRFRCLVNHDGDLDERMAYFDTEELWFPEWDHRGTPWDNPAGYEDQNPLRFVANWKTPMLVIHGQQDFRVALTQGLGTFNALQRRGVSSKLLYFPDESHWVLKPHNSILWHDTVISWLDQWLKK
jgi:dipeptidyl aminopeptidase/acylaminoacyl peptidase